MLPAPGGDPGRVRRKAGQDSDTGQDSDAGPDGDTGPDSDADQDGDAGQDGDIGRDRDTAGRARNSRPRDGLGRPLDRGSAGEPAIPDEPAQAPANALQAAQRLLDAGRPFHAHEVLEASWKAAPAAERDLWQGLAQLAVGVTHARRGNARGAVTLLRRGADRVGRYRGASPHGVDAAGLVTAATVLATRIDRDGLGQLGPGDLRLRLRAQPASG